MNNDVKPIFIFSLPRSGSTLLQRILMSHDKIASVSEPWILLPLIQMTKETGTIATYSHVYSQRALHDLISEVKRNGEDYHSLLGEFVNRIYSTLSSKTEEYFLDKTPRYYLIIDEINRIFPNAKFIFLTRNPISVINSLLNTKRKNRLKYMYNTYSDLFYGPQNLKNGWEKHSNKSVLISYENLTSSPESTIRQVMEFLDLEYSENLLTSLNRTKLSGKMGDKSENLNSPTIIKNKLDPDISFNTLIRKFLLKKYLNKNLDNYIFSTEIEKQNTLDFLKKIKINFIKSMNPLDYYDLLYCILVFKLNLHLVFSKQYKWIKKEFLQ